MRGVILCAGYGTRMQPFSFTVPKTLLPVANRPILDHCIAKMVQAGIHEIGIVLNPKQKSIIDHLSKYKDQLSLQYIYQTEPLGIAHALKEAQSFVGDNSFILMLGDNLIAEPIDTLIEADQGNRGTILLSEVDNPSDYGIAEIQTGRVVKLEEKPKHPKSNLAVIGMYLFDSSIFQAIDHIAPSERGEYEITDAIQWMIDQGYPISYSITKKPYTDVGTIERWLSANQWMLAEQLKDQVRSGENTKLENCIIKGPVLIGKNCTIQNATIGPYVSIGDDSVLIDCHIENSICLKGSKIINISSPIISSILGRGTTLQGTSDERKKLRLILGDHSKMFIDPR
jgi:glucose-1-phosphate thymidylyltransferase